MAGIRDVAKEAGGGGGVEQRGAWGAEAPRHARPPFSGHADANLMF